MSFKDYLIPNWLRNTTNFINFNKNSNNEIKTNLSETNIRNDCRINDGIDPNLYDSSRRLRSLTESWVPSKGSITEINPNDYLSKPSTSTAMFNTNDQLRQSTSYGNQMQSQVIDLEADDRSSSSSATASSTSGCSSLVPSHSDNVLRLGLPLETMRKELAKIKTRESVTANDSILNKALIIDEKRSNPNLSNSMKQFSVQKFMSPSSVLSQKSHFYEGKTIYGGANVSRAARLAGTTPYNLSSRHSLAPVMKVQVKDSKRIDTNDQLSSSTKKIFEKLEKASTPIQDAKRIPLYSSNYRNYFQSSQQLLRSNKRPKIGPPIAPLLTPNKSTIDNKNKPFIKWQLTEVLSEEKKSGNNDNLNNKCDINSLYDSKKNELNDNKVNEGGGKMMRKDNKRNINEDSAEYVENDLSGVRPLSFPSGISLPKFDFGNSASFQKQSSANKALPTTTLTRVEDESTFKFSLPILKKTEKVVEFDSKDKPFASTPFTFSSPKGVETQIPDFSQVKNTDNTNKTIQSKRNALEAEPQTKSDKISTDSIIIENKSRVDWNKQKEDKWVCECLYYNNYGENKCMACHKERGSKPVDDSKSFVPKISWADKFKPPEGSWNCSICMINNSSEKTKCAACETPKPGLKSEAIPKDNIKSSEVWQCFYCKENNDISRSICISCEKVKTPIASKADLDKLYCGQTFKFGISENKENNKKIDKKEDNTNNNIKDKKETIETNSLFSKSSENQSETCAPNPNLFNFGVKPSPKPTAVESITTNTSVPKQTFSFGLTTTPSTVEKSTESSTATTIETVSTYKTSNLFQFGAPIPSNTTISAPEFIFGNQSKLNEGSKTRKTVSFESETSAKESAKPSETEIKLQSESTFQFTKPTEEKSGLFSFGQNSTAPGFSSTLNTSLFGSNTGANNSAVTTVSQTSTTSLSNTFNPLTNVTPNSSMTSIFALPVTTNSSLSSSSLLSTNKFNNDLKSQSVVNTSSEEVGKNLFALNSGTNKPFNTFISTNLNQKPITSTSSLTSTTSSAPNTLVFGNSNPTLPSLSSTAVLPTPKPNFSFNINANTSNEETFASTKLFGSTTSNNKLFNFGNAPSSSSQTGFSFSHPTPITSSNFNLGLSSSNNTNIENNNTKPLSNSLFTFGQNNEQFSSSSMAQKNSNINSAQFSFGANQSTGQNNTNIFGNAVNNSTQPNLSFNPPSVTTNTPFSFGFGATQPTPAVPQIQAQPQQPPPQYNFAAQPSFDFARMNSTTNQSSPVFQFS